MSKWNAMASPCAAVPLGEAPWGTGLWNTLCARSLQKQHAAELWN